MYTAISSFVHSSWPPGVSKTLINLAPWDKAPECKSRILAPPDERPFSSPFLKIFTNVLTWSSWKRSSTTNLPHCLSAQPGKEMWKWNYIVFGTVVNTFKSIDFIQVLWWTREQMAYSFCYVFSLRGPRNLAHLSPLQNNNNNGNTRKHDSSWPDSVFIFNSQWSKFWHYFLLFWFDYFNIFLLFGFDYFNIFLRTIGFWFDSLLNLWHNFNRKSFLFQ